MVDTGSDLIIARGGHTATLLPNGKVLIHGGTPQPFSGGSAELYDPKTGTWTGLSRSRFRAFFAFCLSGNRVLFFGDGVVQTYNPVNDHWRVLGNTLPGTSATLLKSGEILLVDKVLPNTYNPNTTIWTSTGFLNEVRDGQTATVL